MASNFIAIKSEVDDVELLINQKAESIAKLLAKEIIENTLTVEDVQKMLDSITVESIKTKILMQTVSIVSKLVTSAASKQTNQTKSNNKSFWGDF